MSLKMCIQIKDGRWSVNDKSLDEFNDQERDFMTDFFKNVKVYSDYPQDWSQDAIDEEIQDLAEQLESDQKRVYLNLGILFGFILGFAIAMSLSLYA